MATAGLRDSLEALRLDLRSTAIYDSALERLSSCLPRYPAVAISWVEFAENPYISQILVSSNLVLFRDFSSEVGRALNRSGRDFA